MLITLRDDLKLSGDKVWALPAVKLESGRGEVRPAEEMLLSQTSLYWPFTPEGSLSNLEQSIDYN